MKRGGPLQRRTPLKGGQPLPRGGGLARGGPLAARSEKTRAVYVDRRKIVADLVGQRCEAQIPGVCLGHATQVHEVLTRARGGSILDRDNLLALCGTGGAGCHPYITAHPAWADNHGFTLPSWEGPEYDAARERRNEWRRAGRPVADPPSQRDVPRV